MLTLIFVLSIAHTIGKPLTNPTNDAKTSDISMDEIFDFLTNYGYLIEKRPSYLDGTAKNKKNYNVADVSSSLYYQPIEVETALKEFQHFMGIQETGKLNVDTINYMRKPRCGEKDRVPRDILSLTSSVKFTTQGKAKNSTYSSYFYKSNYNKLFKWAFDDSKKPRKISYAEAYYGFQYALNRWAAVCNVVFQRVDLKSADIVVSFFSGSHGDGNPFDGPGGILAHASSTNYQVHFDDDESFNINSVHTLSFKRPIAMPDYVQTAIHEVGHLLGFRHSTNKDSVMYPTILAPAQPGDIYELHDSDISNAISSWGKCWPHKIDAMFSNVNNGKTYIFINYFAYELDDYKLQVAQSWPRLTYTAFAGYDKVDEVFMHKGMIYMVKGDTYRFDWAGAYSPEYKISTKFHPSLTSIDAAFTHTDGKLYIIKKDLVYRWDDTATTNTQPLFPKGALEKGWPKKLRDVFPGVKESPDTAFRWYYTGKVYFFKGQFFQQWDDKNNNAGKYIYDTRQWQNVCDAQLCLSNNQCYHWGS